MSKKTHRYRIKAKVRASVQYDDSYMISKPIKSLEKKAKNHILSAVDTNWALWGTGEVKNEDVEISNLEIEDLGPCSEDFYDTGEC